LTLVAAVAGVLLAPTLGYGFGYDHGVMQYLGAAAVRGEWPYAQAWDTAFPGGVAIHMIAAAIGPRSVLALRALDLAITTGALVVLYAAGRRLAGAWAGCFAAVSYGLVYVASGYYQTAQRDGWIVPCLVLAVLALWDFREAPVRRGALVRAGAWLAAVGYLRPTYAPVGALMVAWVALVPAGTRTPIRRAADAGLVCLTAACLLLVFPLTYLLAGRIGSLGELLRAQATIYPALERFPIRQVLSNALRFPPAVLLFGAALAGLLPSSRPRRHDLALLAVALVGTLLVRIWEAKGWFYQYWPMIGVLAVLAGAGWAQATDLVAARVIPRSRVGATFAVLAALALTAGGGPRRAVRRYRAVGTGIRASLARPVPYDQLVADSRPQAALARWLDLNARPDGRIQLWGAETNVLVATGRRSATRFTDPFLLFCSDSGLHLFSTCPSSAATTLQWRLRREIVDSLRADPPDFIVAHYADGTLATHEGAAIAPDLPELRALLDARYVADTTFGVWTAFRRRDVRRPNR
jgi:hypothetical protein